MGSPSAWEKGLCCTLQNRSDVIFDEIPSCEGVRKDQRCSAERLWKTLVWSGTWFEDDIFVMAQKTGRIMISYPTMEGLDECVEVCSSQVELEAMGCACEKKIMADRGSFWTKKAGFGTERQSCEYPPWSCMRWFPYSEIKH